MEPNDRALAAARSDRQPYGCRRVVAASIVAVPVVLLVLLAARCGNDQQPQSQVPGAPPTAVATTTTTPPTTSTTTAPTTTSPPTTAAVTTVAATEAPATTSPPATAVVGATHSIDEVGGPWWLVNGDRPLPPGYVPPELVTPAVPVDPDASFTQLTPETAAAFEQMVAAAAIDGHHLQLNSAYRSEADQAQLYELYVRDFGAEAAARLVARPGTSEHQTGLAADVGLVGLPDDQTFGSTEASAWVAANAHRFGLIVRYPPDKAAITGYANEPWHLRYVGTDLAGVLHASGLTMEEHFGLAG